MYYLNLCLNWYLIFLLKLVLEEYQTSSLKHKNIETQTVFSNDIKRYNNF